MPSEANFIFTGLVTVAPSAGSAKNARGAGGAAWQALARRGRDAAFSAGFGSELHAATTSHGDGQSQQCEVSRRLS